MMGELNNLENDLFENGLDIRLFILLHLKAGSIFAITKGMGPNAIIALMTQVLRRVLKLSLEILRR